MKEKVRLELHRAMKNKDAFRAGTLRLIIAEIVKKEKEGRGELTEQDVAKVLFGMLRQREDSITQFENAGRNDLAQTEAAEIKIVQEFLPQQLSEDEIKKEAQKVISEVGAEDMKSMGKVMGILTNRLAGKAQGGVISKIVKDLLAS